VADLNRLYRKEAALHQIDASWQGFEWIDLHDVDNSILSFRRMAADPDDSVIVICNFTPVPRMGYRVGLPQAGIYTEILNSDAPVYGGSGVGNPPEIAAEAMAWQSGSHSALFNLPPLAVLFVKRLPDGPGNLTI